MQIHHTEPGDRFEARSKGAAVRDARTRKVGRCGAAVTEHRTRSWHSETGLRALRHRKPAAVTQAGYAYCQIRDTHLSVKSGLGTDLRSPETLNCSTRCVQSPRIGAAPPPNTTFTLLDLHHTGLAAVKDTGQSAVRTQEFHLPIEG